MKTSRRVPPDGGYGWVIVFASGLNNFILTPQVQCFGLIFTNTFTDLGFSATQGSLIINLNGAFGMLTGLINGVLLKTYGYRKIAVVAGILLTIGTVLTSFSNNFTLFIISYGLITSLGNGMCRSAYGLAINTYFKSKRNVAMGYAVTAAGLGPILIPQLISFLMKNYTPAQVTLIFGGIATHVFVSACLLQPVKWHMKEEEIDGLGPDPENKENSNCNIKIKNEENEELSLNGKSKEQYNCDNITNCEEDKQFSLRRKSEDNCDKPRDEVKCQNGNKEEQTESLKKTVPEPHSRPNTCQKLIDNIVKTFDLDLLKDPIFVNIMLGMALAIFAELNFTILTPFILDEFELDTEQIATFLSTLGVTDILFRFCAPYIGNYFTTPPRLMYAYSLVLLILTRSVFLLSRNFYILLVTALALGIAKGVRRVYMALVIPAHVPLEKFASANGMEMMINGFCIIIGGPLLGAIKDATGSYILSVVIMNCVTFTTLLMWMVEAVIVKYCNTKQNEDVELDSVAKT